MNTFSISVWERPKSGRFCNMTNISQTPATLPIKVKSVLYGYINIHVYVSKLGLVLIPKNNEIVNFVDQS